MVNLRRVTIRPCGLPASRIVGFWRRGRRRIVGAVERPSKGPASNKGRLPTEG